MSTFEGILEKEKSEWLAYLDKARELTGVDESKSIKLTFEKRKSLIEIQVPQGRLSSALYDTSININPEVCEVETSSNFKLISLSHELGEYHRSCSPIIIIHSLFLWPWPKYKERYVNKLVHNKLVANYGETEAKRMMRGFVGEWLSFPNKNSVSENYVKSYIEKCMPFLIEQIK